MMLLKTRSRFRHFATHPVMSMKIKHFQICLYVTENTLDMPRPDPGNRRLVPYLAVLSSIQ